MKPKQIIQISAILGMLAVVLGAFGAHGLAAHLESIGRTDTFETAVKYHFYHTLAILGVGLLAHYHSDVIHFRNAAWLFLVGILIFSGSLYVMSLTGITWLGAITPLGGVGFIAGWGLLFWGASKTVD